MKRFILDVPVPPSVNHCYWYRNNRKYRTKIAQNYVEMIQKIAMSEMAVTCFAMFPAKEKLYIELTYYFPDARRRDTHNTLKLLFDAWNEIVYPDDQYLLPKILDFSVDRQNPHVHIEIYKKGDKI